MAAKWIGGGAEREREASNGLCINQFFHSSLIIVLTMIFSTKHRGHIVAGIINTECSPQKKRRGQHKDFNYFLEIFYIKHWKVKSFITHLDYELVRDKSTDNLRHEPDEGLTQHPPLYLHSFLCFFNAFETRNSAMKSNNIIAHGVHLL